MNTAQLKTRTTVGLEIHVQLKTRTKMFCACPVTFDTEPNSCVCPVCLGYPGALPTMNRQAFDLAALAGMALNCQVATFTKWDRKSYFYPDLPKNYQISQYDLPMCVDGYFAVTVNGQVKRIRIRRAHLEEDAGKNIHADIGTLVDLNRAGTPLLEIVTEPDVESAEEAFVFCTELHRLMTYLGVSEGNMKKGQMRFEPNINLAIETHEGVVHTPIAEVKNLNSFRAVRDAIAYEAERQRAAWTEDPDYLLGRAPNENRGWNADRGVTDYQRPKEAAHDYRYFPDPDLLPVNVSEAMLEDFRSRLPELPIARQARFEATYKLAPKDAAALIDRRATADLFEATVDSGGPPHIVGKQFVNVWLRLANERHVGVTQLGVHANQMADLARLTSDGTISATAARQVAEALVLRSYDSNAADRDDGLTAEEPAGEQGSLSTRDVAEELGLIQVKDEGATAAWVAKAFSENEQAVLDAITNPKKAKAAAGFLRGQVMKLSGGKADPKLIGRLIEEQLDQRRRDRPNG